MKPTDCPPHLSRVLSKLCQFSIATELSDILTNKGELFLKRHVLDYFCHSFQSSIVLRVMCSENVNRSMSFFSFPSNKFSNEIIIPVNSRIYLNLHFRWL